MKKIEFESQSISEDNIVVKLKNCVTAFGDPIYVGPNGPTERIENAVVMPAFADLSLKRSDNKSQGISFGQAIEALKEGKSVKRSTWYGKGMCLWLNKGNSETISPGAKQTIEDISETLFELGPLGSVRRLPNINLTTPIGSTCVWSASQTDMLAEDWEVID